MSLEPDKKLFVDEDWKAKVERERTTAEQSESELQTGPSDSPNDAPQEFSPTTLLTLVQLLGMQSMMALGILGESEGAAPKCRPAEARHFIDLLSVLQEKTKGNLTPTEDKVLEDTLYQLRMAFVQITGK